MQRKFKSYDQAKEVGEAMKKEIGFVNFRAKSIKEVGEGETSTIEIKGYASTKDRDRYGDIVEPKAFDNTMEKYMANPMLLLQHDPSKQIGVVTAYEIDKTGLLIEGEVKYNAGDTELFEKITNGDLKGFSIGFRIKDLELLEEETDEGTLYTWIIKELELLEISVVTIPANPYTLMKSLDDLFIKSSEGMEVAEETPAEEPEVEEPVVDDEPTEEIPEEETPAEETPEETPADEPAEEPEIETPADTPEEKNIETEDEPEVEKPEIDNESEKDNIDESESDEPENQPETTDDSETPNGDDEKEKQANFTLKMIEKLVGAKTEAMEKQFQAREKTIREELEKAFDDKMKAFETENVKMLEGLFEIIQSHGEQIKTVAEGTKNLTSGKGFIYTEVTPKDDTAGRDKLIMSKFAGMKKHFNS